MAFPNTFLDLQRKVQNKLRLDANVDASSGNDLNKIKDTINEVYAQVCVQTEANQTSATALLISGQSSYAMPSEILRIKQIVAMPSGQSAYGPPLIETTINQLLYWRQTAGAGATGSVTHYALVGMNQLEVWPTPSAADTLLIYYVALPTALSATTDVPILQEPWGSKLIEYGALAEMSDFLRGADDPSTKEYRQLYAGWMAQFRIHLNRRAGGRTMQMPVVGYDRNGWVPHLPSADVRC